MSSSSNLTSPSTLSDCQTSSSDDTSSEYDVVPKMLQPMSRTAALRTRVNMFGITDTELTKTIIIHPVLYVALYSTGDAPSEVDDYHWAFIVGPSHEEADSKGTLYTMEPRLVPQYTRPYSKEWCWLYNQPTVFLRGQWHLLARLMIAEVADMNMLQAIVLRWGARISMQTHVGWMSVRWVKSVLKSLDEDDGCFGRRMESFESVEAKGRRLANMEEKKRKGYCLLDARVSTLTLFEREITTALLSTATADIAIRYPVLYIAVYKNHRPSRENDEYRWAFLIGPSHETAQSEGVRCGVELHLDFKGRPTWNYSQTIVPLRGEDDMLARLLIADVVNLRPLGEVIRDYDITPTVERTDSMVGDSEWNSVDWVREKLDMLERKPECFAYKCHDFSMFERMGRKLAGGWNQPRKKGARSFGVEVSTLVMVRGWERPDDDEANVAVNLDLARGEPDMISRAIQVGTGVLGAASLAMRQRITAREQRERKVEQQGKAHCRFRGSENETTSTERTKLQHMNEAKKTAGEVGEDEVTARPESAYVTTIDFALPNKPDETSEASKAGEDHKDEEESESEDDEDEDEDEDDEDEVKDDDEDEDESSDEDESNTDEVAEENVGEEKADSGSEGVPKPNVRFFQSKKDEQVSGEEKVGRENKEDKDETGSGEDEDMEESEEESEDESEDDDREDDANNEDEGEDSSDDEDDEEDEEEKENGTFAGVRTTVKNIPTITLSA